VLRTLAIGLVAGVALGATPLARPAALLDAVKAGHSSEALRLLESGSGDAGADEADGTTVLHYAVELDDAALVGRLLDAGADAAAENRYGVSPIYLAALNGNADIVSQLLDHGVDPNTALPEGETALMTAARAGDIATIDALVEAGADVNAREGWKAQTALMWAAAENNADAVTRLLQAGADRDATSAGGEYSAIKFAVRAGAIDSTRALLDAGADVDETMIDGTSLLVLAVTNAHYELASDLLDYGADPNADDQGWTALHQVAWSRRWNMGFNLPGPYQTGNLDSLDLVRKLVEHGGDIDARQHQEPKDGNRNKLDRIGATAFLLAAKSCDLPLMRVLLELGADPAITTENGTTALMAAAGVGIWAPGENPGSHEEALAAVKLAFEVGGGDVNAVNAEGDTALHGAVYRGGALPVIEFLVERGAKLDAVNTFGWMPVTAADGLEYTPAVLKRYPEAAALLRRYMTEQGLPVPDSSQPGRRAE
jgi:ankyrin repeat protein